LRGNVLSSTKKTEEETHRVLQRGYWKMHWASFGSGASQRAGASNESWKREENLSEFSDRRSSINAGKKSGKIIRRE